MQRFSTLLLVCFISTVFFQIAFSAPTTTTSTGTATNGTSVGNNTSNLTSSTTNAGTTVRNTASTGTSGGNNTSSGTPSGNNTSSNETPVARNGNKIESSSPRTMLPLLIFAFLQIPLAWN